MMKAKVKRMLCVLTMGFCLMGTTLPVCAQTINFNITVPGDPTSKRATKADSEQRFYVTGTSFNKSGVLNCTSIKLNNTAIKSNGTGISTGMRSSSATYRSNAASGALYYMSTSANVSNLKVLGRYTP